MELKTEGAPKHHIDALHMIHTERANQVMRGLTPERDLALYHMCELPRAAASYVTPQGYRNHGGDGVPKMWPWHPSTFKPGGQTYEGRMAELAKAGALILAEMERMMLKQQRSDELRASRP